MLERADGRAPSQLRPLLCERALLHAADGGAKWTAGACSDTLVCVVWGELPPACADARARALLLRRRVAERTGVLAAAYGPRSLPPRREHAERATLDVALTPASGVAATHERSACCCVRAALQAVLLAGLHPRTGISIVLQARAAARRCFPSAATPPLADDYLCALDTCADCARGRRSAGGVRERRLRCSGGRRRAAVRAAGCVRHERGAMCARHPPDACCLRLQPRWRWR
jgi:hypothetical protein